MIRLPSMMDFEDIRTTQATSFVGPMERHIGQERRWHEAHIRAADVRAACSMAVARMVTDRIERERAEAHEGG